MSVRQSELYVVCHKVGCFCAVGQYMLENNGITVILKTADSKVPSPEDRICIQGAWLLHWVTTLWCCKYEDRVSTVHAVLNNSTIKM